MKKKMYVLGVAALVAAMLALSGVAQSAMWVGAELGGNFPLNTNINVICWSEFWNLERRQNLRHR